MKDCPSKYIGYFVEVKVKDHTIGSRDFAVQGAYGIVYEITKDKVILKIWHDYAGDSHDYIALLKSAIIDIIPVSDKRYI